MTPDIKPDAYLHYPTRVQPNYRVLPFPPKQLQVRVASIALIKLGGGPIDGASQPKFSSRPRHSDRPGKAIPPLPMPRHANRHPTFSVLLNPESPRRLLDALYLFLVQHQLAG